MLKEKMRFERRNATMLEFDFNGTTEEYALAWLKLTNNAREYSNTIWKIFNTRSNRVYVICNPKSKDTVKEFCTGIISYYHEDTNTINEIGTFISESEIEIGVPIYEYESTYSIDNSEKWENDISKSITYWIDTEEEY